MKRSAILILCALAAAVAGVSCVKLTLYNTTHPNQGGVKLTTQWSVPVNVTEPTGYDVKPVVKEAVKQTLSYTEKSNMLPLLDPESYYFLVHNNPEKVSTNATKAEVGKLSDGTLEPMPGWLFVGGASAEVVADAEQEVVAPVKQYMYELAFEMPVVDGSPESIASWSASMSGIAYKMDMTNASIMTSVADAADINLDFKLGTDNVMRATIRILGYAGTKQSFSMVLTYINGKKQTILSDFSDTLIDSKTQKPIDPSVNPFVKLTYKISAPVPVDDKVVEATIADWEIVSYEDRVE